MKRKISVLVILFFTSSLVFAQPVLETNPTSTKWYQVSTPHFNILFQKGFHDQAQRIVRKFEQVYLPESETLGSRPSRISVLIQNQSSISNGFVSYIPRRSELYAMPSQNYNFTGTNEWFDMLVTHEYRHVVQFQHATQGINRLLFYLSGYQTLTGFAHIAVPAWFWEGDAVVAETAFTRSGRGRIPNFALLLKTNLLEGREFNYHKQLLGSFKHNIPGEYVLGYHMVSYLRKRTGDPMIWGKISGRSWQYSLIPYTFSNAIKKETGMYVTSLYREMVNDLRQEWRQETDSLVLTPFEKVSFRKNEAYTDYLYPQLLNDGSIVAVKTGIGDIRQLVVLKGNGSRKLFVQGIVNDAAMLSAAAGKVVWNEHRFDPRWMARNYSVINSYDVSSGRKLQVTPTRSRVAGASLSPDGLKIVTVQTDTSYRHALLVLDASSGNEIKEFTDPENKFFSMPRWSNDGSRIVVLKTGEKGRSVVAIHAENGTVEELIPEGEENIGHPVLSGDFLFYNSPVTGIDNIFAMDINTGKRYQVTVSRYGAYNPCISPDGKMMYYNDQSRNGMDVVRTRLDPSTWRPINDTIESVTETLSQMLEAQENSDPLKDIPTTEYPVQKYSRIRSVINPYAWGIYVDQNDLSSATASISSRDILSTTEIQAGYEYDILENTGSFFGTLSYQGLYPILDFGINYGKRDVITGVFGRDVKFNWTETGISGGVRVPLMLTRSKYFSELTVGNTLGLTLTSSFQSEVTEGSQVIVRGIDRYVPANDSLFYVFTNRTDYGTLISNQFSISYDHVLKQSHRDFNPRFGQLIDFEHFSTPYGGDYYGRLWAARALLYFPGLLKHHSLHLRGAYQQVYSSPELNTYSFRNRIFKPRGYSYPADVEFYMASVNYALPLWYPDIAVGPVLNIQRIRTNLFVDHGHGKSIDYFHNFSDNGIYSIERSLDYNSAGIELTFDVNFFRYPTLFQVGARTTYRQANDFHTSGVVFEILFGNIAF